MKVKKIDYSMSFCNKSQKNFNYLLLIFFVLLINVDLTAQLAPFTDMNRFFKTFYKNNIRQLEFQAIKSFEASDNLIVYVDFRGDFKVYNGETVELITNQLVNYKLSDNQLAWNIGPVIYHYSPDYPKKNLLTMFGNQYWLSDSLLVFEDTRYNTVNVRSRNENMILYQLTGDLYGVEELGDNTIVFRENGDFLKFFWNNKIHDFAVYTRKIEFSCGVDVICFNDPINQTFAVFDKGTIVDVESLFVKKFKALRNFVAYEDNQNNLWIYKNGEKEMLSNFNVNFWNALDNLIVWEEGGLFYIYEKDKGKKQLLNYIPQDYQIKNNTLVFRNNMGGIQVYQNGVLKEITKQLEAKYKIYGNTVLVELFNQNYLIYHDGKIYNN
ncbi:MAG: hypothetical protein HYU67_13225 [Flavobacteriia bacterium]|nr:hypothetical protein [Flavobacteriia bacterium]